MFSGLSNLADTPLGRTGHTNRNERDPLAQFPHMRY
jgi:hypothetical protein